MATVTRSRTVTAGPSSSSSVSSSTMASLRAADMTPLRPTTTTAPAAPAASSSSSSSSSSPPRNHAIKSDSALVKTPVANSSLLENDSPLPSPPRMSKLQGEKTSPTRGLTFSDLGTAEDEQLTHQDPRMLLGAKQYGAPSRTVSGALKYTDERETSRRTSPTAADALNRGSHSTIDSYSSSAATSSTNAYSSAALPPPSSSRSPTPLADSAHAPSPPSFTTSASSRAQAGSRLGYKPLLTTSSRVNSNIAGRSVSGRHEADGVDDEEEGEKRSFPNSRSIHMLAQPRGHRPSPSIDAVPDLPRLPSRSSEEPREPLRASSSLARTSRESSAEHHDPYPRPASEARVSRRRIGATDSDGNPLRTSGDSERPHSRLADAVTDDQARQPRSTEQKNSPPQSTVMEAETKPSAYTTPALAAGARTLRSTATTTVGRSGRTLRKTELKAHHIRPTRVIMTQGADESDGEEEEEAPGVGVGAALPTPQGTPHAAIPPLSRGLSRIDMDATSTPPMQSASTYLEGLSLHSSKANASVTVKKDDPLGAGYLKRSPIGDRGAVDSKEGLNHAVVGHASRQAHPRTPEVAPAPARKEAFPYPRGQRFAVAEEDDAEGKDNVLSARDFILNERQDKQAADKKALGDVLSAKVPMPDAQASAGPRRSVAPTGDRAPLGDLAGLNRSAAASYRSPPRVVPASPARDDLGNVAAQQTIEEMEEIAKLEPHIEAEKRRLLDLNGWDPYVRAALEEAQRQRHNGCRFGEHLVGKAMSNQKETKFRGAKYMKISKAGEGGFSTVFQVLGPTFIPTVHGELEPVPPELQAHFALKQVSLKKLEQSSRDELLREAELLENLAEVEGSEQYVLRYFGHKHSGDTLKILMELGEMDFNTLLRSQHPLPRSALSSYWKQMLESVHFVHNAKLVHTDLKPANFLMVKGRIKLIDFGIAQKIPLGTSHIHRDNIVGTPNYMAPEAIQKARRGGHGVYKAGKPSDVWSLGCILYQMVYGRTPFAHIQGDRKLEVITDPKHVIALPLRRTLDDPASTGGHHHPSSDGSDGSDGTSSSPPEAEEVDEILLDCLRSSLLYSSVHRARIPTLLDHLFVRDDVTLTRSKLKDIVLRIQAYMQQGGLNDDNVAEMAQRLMTNLQLEAFVPFDPEAEH